MKFINSILTLLIFIFLHTSVCAQVKDIGIPSIKNYKRSDYRGGTQNWSIDQDKNGNMYFANNNGLIQFDGSSWHKYSLPTQNEIRSLKIDSSGKIFEWAMNICAS